jgi:Xaa-Pro dipeptidase
MRKNSIFTKEEYQQRVRKTKEMMDKGGIEILLVTDPANMNYLIGYDGWSFYVHQGVIVSLDAEQPFWFGREQDSNGARITSWLPDDCIYGYPDEYVQSRYTHTMRWVAVLLREKGLEKKRFGLEMDGYWFNARMYVTLLEELPQALLMDATNLVNWVRLIKSEKEIEYMRMASQIVERVMQTAIDTIAAGVREGDAAARVFHAQISGTPEFTGDYSAIMPIMPSGIRTSTAHLSWTDRKYEVGDIVLLELSGCKSRYHAPLSRTVMIGKPPAELEDIAKAVVDGLNQTLDFIQPGVTGEEVEARWREAIAGSRVVKESRIGYAYGLNYPPDWGEHTVSLRPGDKTVFRPSMTIHVMPGIWLDKFGFECSEPIRVTESGCETFVDFPRKLFVK